MQEQAGIPLPLAASTDERELTPRTGLVYVEDGYAEDGYQQREIIAEPVQIIPTIYTEDAGRTDPAVAHLVGRLLNTCIRR